MSPVTEMVNQALSLSHFSTSRGNGTMKTQISSFALMTVLLLCGLVSMSSAQGTNGNILGTVNDSTGAVIPNAQVTATNLETNFARTAVTNSAGEYLIQFLPPGSYRVEVAASGFKK